MAGLNTDTKLLMHFDGPDGAKEVIDSGNTGHIITQNGSAILQTSQVKIGSSSLDLNGTNAYISTGNHSDFTFGTSSFTIEAWIRPRNVGGAGGANNDNIFSWKTTGGTWQFIIENTTGELVLWSETFVLITTASAGLVNDVWAHVALVRDGNDWEIFVDGVSKGTATNTKNSSVPNGGFGVLVGAEAGSATQYFDGYIDELRVSKAIARYTAPFTPSTTEFVSDANTVYLLHMNLLDVSGDGGSGAYHTASFIGTAQLDTAVNKWGTGSLFVDGNSDFVEFPDSSDWDILTTTDFTIDFWVYHTDTINRDECYVAQLETVSPLSAWYLRAVGNASVNVTLWNAGAAESIDTGANVVTQNNWHHIALIKKGSTWGIYVDGVQEAYKVVSMSRTFASTLRVGARHADQYFAGNIDELRVQPTNIFSADPNVGKTDTITVPTEAYGPAGPAITSRNQIIIIT